MTTKTERQVSELSGELVTTAPVEVPFASGFSIEALKLVDENPVFATVKIKSGKGDQGAGPYYGPHILQNLAQQINEKRPPGYRGHQDPDKVNHEWREPVTAWVGATFVPDGSEGDLYVKGYVPPTAEQLRTQLKLASSGADIVNSVSIFGIRDVDLDKVVKFDLWSLDWTPRGRAGMETELVGVSGEQTKEEEEMDRDQIIAGLKVSDVPDHVSGEIRKDEREKVIQEHRPLSEAVGEMRVILELDSGADADAIVEALRALMTGQTETEVEATVDEAIDGQIESNDLVKAAVRDVVLPKVTAKTTEAELKGEIESALKVPYIAALGTGQAPVVQGGGSESKSDDQLVAAHWE